MSLNLLFLLHKKSVFQKKVTKSRIVTKFTVTKSKFDCITCPTKALLGQLDKDFGNWSIWDFNCNLTRFGKHKTNNKITTSSRKSFQYFFFYLDCNRLPAKTLMNFDENSLYKINK